MTYSVNYVTGGSWVNSTIYTSMPSTFPCALCSMWVELGENGGFNIAPIEADIPGFAYRGFTITSQGSNWPQAGNLIQVNVADGSSSGLGIPQYFGIQDFDVAFMTGTDKYNIIVSIDSVANVIQVAINGTLISPNGDYGWARSSQMARPGTDYSPDNFSVGPTQFGLTDQGCIGDVYVALPSTFYDLSDPDNIAKFINLDGSPVDLGTTATGPLGSEPLVYLSRREGDPVSAFLTNRTATSGVFASGAGITACAGEDSPFSDIETCCTYTQVSMADLWFGSTSGFVDLTTTDNRRKFISAEGGAQNLGGSGSQPFGSAPTVFLTNTGVPNTFATNNGTGGSFAISFDKLYAGPSNPPGTSTTTVTTQDNTLNHGVLGDYRNGRLYAFNKATLTDNGTPRKWLRRWRALDKATEMAVKFNWLTVGVQTGLGVPPGTNPQLMLRWSDDGGNTFSHGRFLSVGKTGATTARIKFNRLGMTRRYGGSDRIFELSSTDPFEVAITDADTEAV